MRAQEDIGAYLKTIEELRRALGREQQLRLLYEQELLEMHKKSVALRQPLSLDPGLASLDLLLKTEGESSLCLSYRKSVINTFFVKYGILYNLETWFWIPDQVTKSIKKILFIFMYKDDMHNV